jgi:hypothetical protein
MKLNLHLIKLLQISLVHDIGSFMYKNLYRQYAFCKRVYTVQRQILGRNWDKVLRVFLFAIDSQLY